MLCLNVRTISWVLSWVTTLAAASVASAQASWKLYDLRDLMGLLPEPVRVDPSGPVTPAVMILDGERPTPRLDPVDELMDTLCNALPVHPIRLFPGVYGIEADETDHAALLGLLEKIRELYTERYEVEVLWYIVSPDQAPSIGDPVTPTEPVHRHRLVVARRAPTELAQVSRYAYVSGIQPVLAQQAVGYSLETSREESGLRLSILVGAGRETETATSIRVTGDLRRVATGKTSGSLVPDEVGGAEIELPEVRIRSIRSSIRIEYGNVTALAVMDGFDDGECVLVAASVRKLRD